MSDGLDAYRLPLSAIRDAQTVVVLGDVPLAESAPIVDLWVRAARRNGATIVHSADDPAVSSADRVVLIWSGPGGRGGARVGALAEQLGLAGKDGCGAFYIPTTPNGRGVADAWAACSDEEPASEPDSIGLLLVSGDEAAGDPNVRALAERADAVIVVSMFMGLAAGWADLVAAGLELSRARRHVREPRGTPAAPAPGGNAARPERARMDLAARARASASRSRRTRRPCSPSSRSAATEASPSARSASAHRSASTPKRPSTSRRRPCLRPKRPPATACTLVAYTPLFSGPAVERVPELQFQRPPAEVTLARSYATAKGIANGDLVTVSSNGTSIELRAKLSNELREGVALIADEHTQEHARQHLHRAVAEERGERVTEPWWIALIEAAIVVNLVLVSFAYLTLIERKLMGRMQLRYGPNRAGPFGLLQPIADLVKLVRKEAFSPSSAIEIPYILAPIISAFTAIAAFAVIPFGPGWTINGWQVNGEVANVSIGLLLVFALGSIGIYGFIVGGWASESKFSILGSMRTCAQLVSYEVSLALSVLGVVMLGRSLNLPDIVSRQGEFLPFVIPQFVGLVIFFIAGIAETSRAPFDLPEAEQELVAGYHTEYSGMRWGLFQMAEYINLITLSALMVTLFFSGWHGPWNLGPLWFILKLFGVLFVFIWLRTTLPRLRYDQLMRFGWKVLLPVATINAVITALVVVWV